MTMNHILWAGAMIDRPKHWRFDVSRLWWLGGVGYGRNGWFWPRA